MDYGKSFTFVFEDEKWISKFAVGVLITLVPIVNFATYGYMVQLLKNVRDGQEDPLPEWDDFGKFFLDGLKFLAGYLVYLIPVILLSLITIPVAMAADSGGGSGDFLAMTMICISCLVILLSLLPMLLYPALYIQYAKGDKISDMFRLDEMWDLFKANSANYIIVLLIIFFVLTFIASFGLVLCFVGILLTAWWAQLVAAHLMGQLAQPQEKAASV
jgi:hypothetical protein